MPESDGLPGGPVLKPNLNLNIPQQQGVTPGMVSSSVAGILNGAAGGTDMNVYNAVGKSSGGAPGFPSFKSGGPDPLAQIPSTLQAAVSSASGPELAALKAMMTGMGQPVATISDALSRLIPGATLNRIDQLQQNFLRNHADDLADLSTYMSNAKVNMRNLGYLMQPDSLAKFNLSTSPLQQILDQKKQVGRDLSDQLADAIANTDDPDEKAQLQSEKDQVDKWLANCDQRIAQDQSAISNLQQRVDSVMRVANQQSQALVNAAFSPNPGNMTSNGQIISTTHTDPNAVNYAMGLRQSLIQSRIQMNSAMAGK